MSQKVIRLLCQQHCRQVAVSVQHHVSLQQYVAWIIVCSPPVYRVIYTGR